MRPVLRLVFAAFAAAALLAGCGGYKPGKDAVDLRVRQVFDASRGVYIEGSYSYVRIERPGGGEVLEERLPEGKRAGRTRFVSEVVFRLDGGEYRLVSFQRPCSGNCGSLDPPMDECKRLIRVTRPGAVVTVTVRPGSGCRIELE